MKKNSYLIFLIVIVIAVSMTVTSVMGQDGQGRRNWQDRQNWQGGPSNWQGGSDFQGGRGGRFNMGYAPNMMQQGQMQGMGSGGMWGGMTPEQMQQARMQRMQAMIQNIDVNHNGMIDAEEAQGPNASFVDRTLRRAGVEPKYPMPVSKLQEAINVRFQSGMQGTGPATNQAAASSSAPDKSSEDSKSTSADSAARLVPGFEVAIAKQPPVLGFGVLDTQAASSSKKTGTSSESSSASKSSESSAQLDEKIRNIAASLLKQYDQNKNGQLEKNEWSEMPQVRRGLNKFDKNNDTIITLDELTAWMIADNQMGPRQSSGTALASASSSGSGSNSALQGKSGKSKAYRFLSPTERLPEGLPNWFMAADSDGDGQISMLEYTKGNDTNTKAQEFARYDLNNDGVITAKECLKVEKKK